MLSRLASAFVAAALIAGLAAGIAQAHEGHDHGPSATAARPASLRAAKQRPRTSSSSRWRKAPNCSSISTASPPTSPSANAAIEVETPEGPAKAEAKDDGSYRLRGALAREGRASRPDLHRRRRQRGRYSAVRDRRAGGRRKRRSRASASLARKGRTRYLAPSTGGALLAGILIGAAAMAFGRRRSRHCDGADERGARARERARPRA